VLVIAMLTSAVLASVGESVWSAWVVASLGDGLWWSAWVLDLPSLALLGGVTALYLHGAARRVHAGSGPPRSTAAFLAGVGVTLLAHVSPVASYAGVLLWPHMVQHLLLVLVAAPLLALGAPVATVRLGLPPGPRHALVSLARRSRRWRRAVGDPPLLVLATATHVIVVWVWHTPVLYDAAVSNAALHLLEHATFLGSAVWFWAEVVATARRDRRRQALATACLGAMIVQGGVLGALLTFATWSLYDVYDGWGALTAVEDQQFAGALMWVPPGFVYATVAVRRFVGWLRLAEADARERHGHDRAVTDAREGHHRAQADASVQHPLRHAQVEAPADIER
jgi:putative membrane protein